MHDITMSLFIFPFFISLWSSQFSMTDFKALVIRNSNRYRAWLSVLLKRDDWQFGTGEVSKMVMGSELSGELGFLLSVTSPI